MLLLLSIIELFNCIMSSWLMHMLEIKKVSVKMTVWVCVFITEWISILIFYNLNLTVNLVKKFSNNVLMSWCVTNNLFIFVWTVRNTTKSHYNKHIKHSKKHQIYNYNLFKESDRCEEWYQRFSVSKMLQPMFTVTENEMSLAQLILVIVILVKVG